MKFTIKFTKREGKKSIKKFSNKILLKYFKYKSNQQITNEKTKNKSTQKNFVKKFTKNPLRKNEKRKKERTV